MRLLAILGVAWWRVLFAILPMHASIPACTPSHLQWHTFSSCAINAVASTHHVRGDHGMLVLTNTVSSHVQHGPGSVDTWMHHSTAQHRSNMSARIEAWICGRSGLPSRSGVVDAYNSPFAAWHQSSDHIDQDIASCQGSAPPPFSPIRHES